MKEVEYTVENKISKKLKNDTTIIEIEDEKPIPEFLSTVTRIYKRKADNLVKKSKSKEQ